MEFLDHRQSAADTGAATTYRHTAAAPQGRG